MRAWLASLVLLVGCEQEYPEIASRRAASHPCSVAGDPCDDGDPCTMDSCDVGAGVCRHVLIRPDCCDEPSDCDLLACATGLCLVDTCELDFLRCDAGMPDAGPRDAGRSDAGTADAGREPDAGPRDAGRLDAGARRVPHLRGGACSTAPIGAPGGWWIVLAALLLWRARSRRAAAALVVALSATSAQAQGFRLDHHHAPPAPDDLHWVERASSARGSMVPWVRVSASYADDPLVVEDQGTEIALVAERAAVQASAGLSVNATLHLAVAAAAIVQSGDEADLGAGAPALAVGGAHLGEPRVDARLVLLGRDAPLELALAATLRLPFGAGEALAGDRGVSVLPRVIVSRALDARGSHWSLSAGADVRPEATVADLTVGPELALASGLLYMVTERIGVSGELAASTLLRDAFAEQATPLEATGGLRWLGTTGLVVSLGVGAGLTQGYGAPDARVLAAVGFRALPRQPPPPPPRLDPDPDRDGVLDDDRCPTEPEDRDGHQDADGCPDPDDDGDGVLDAADGCDDAPEDRDGFEDDDGCPDSDDDGDGVLDGADGCRAEPEDRDAWRDDDGCPDPDNDGDGLADASDQCPDEAETVNGTADEDGCPDFIRVAAGEIRTLEPVYFVTNRDTIQERSHAMLAEMARVLLANPDLGRVSIEGHTDSVGSNSHNQRLSERRANSVMRFLVEGGVAAERLSAVGHGETRPVADNDSAGGRALNRRVVFRLVDREAAAQSPAPPSAPSPDQ